jgi:hypothetical protein
VQRALEGHAGVVEADVQPAITLRSALDETLDVVLDADIGADIVGFAALRAYLALDFRAAIPEVAPVMRTTLSLNRCRPSIRTVEGRRVAANAAPPAAPTATPVAAPAKAVRICRRFLVSDSLDIMDLAGS